MNCWRRLDRVTTDDRVRIVARLLGPGDDLLEPGVGPQPLAVGIALAYSRTNPTGSATAARRGVVRCSAIMLLGGADESAPMSAWFAIVVAAVRLAFLRAVDVELVTTVERPALRSGQSPHTACCRPAIAHGGSQLAPLGPATPWPMPTCCEPGSSLPLGCPRTSPARASLGSTRLRLQFPSRVTLENLGPPNVPNAFHAKRVQSMLVHVSGSSFALGSMPYSSPWP